MDFLVTKTETDCRLAGFVEPVMRDMGFVLVRLRFSGKDVKKLQIMAEREDGTMDIEACTDLSRALSAMLDDADPVPDVAGYHLEVSSPGIARPLTRATDFETWAGYRARLRSSIPIDGRRRFSGIVRGRDGEEVLLEIPEGIIGIRMDWLDDARLVLDDNLLARAGTS